MTSKSSDSSRVFGPDLIRATAILFVLLSHTIPGLTTFGLVRATRSWLGFFGVEIFFVLSGYLIGGILLGQLFTGELELVSGLWTFWKRRWFRTLPNYYFFLILFLILNFIVTGSAPSAGWKFVWFGQALTDAHPKFFMVAWSLAVEEWFYFTFPLLLWLMVKIFGSRSLAFWTSVFVLTIVPAVLRSCAPVADWDAGLRKVTLFRLDAIMFGIILAFIKARQPTVWARLSRVWPIGTAGILGMTFYFFGPAEPNIYSLFGSVFSFSLTSFSLSLIFPFIVELHPPPHLLAVSIRKISLWSYSIYLSHTLVVSVVEKFFLHFGWPIHGANAVVPCLLDWVTTFTISAFIFSWYEKPMMDLRDRPLKSLVTNVRLALGRAEGRE